MFAVPKRKKYGKRTKCRGHTFTCKHCGFSIDRHILATLNIGEVFLKTQNVASTDPAERSRMTMMERAVRNCKETQIGIKDLLYHFQ
ncbi:MAG: hypothetical protein ACTSRC_02310 [Candidatus Helarchaeota archaeon]